MGWVGRSGSKWGCEVGGFGGPFGDKSPVCQAAMTPAAEGISVVDRFRGHRRTGRLSLAPLKKADTAVLSHGESERKRGRERI